MNTGTRDAFLAEAEGCTFMCKGSHVTLKKGLPHFYRHRGWALGTAKKMLTEGYKSSTVEEAKEDKSRVVKVNGAVAFRQEDKDAEGAFVSAFAHLSLKR